MPVHIEPQWDRDGVDLYMWAEGPEYRIPYVIQNGILFPDSNLRIPRSAALPATLFIENLIYTDLRKAMIGDAIDRDDALEDTRKVRDRLLTLVEKTFDA